MNGIFVPLFQFILCYMLYFLDGWVTLIIIFHSDC